MSVTPPITWESALVAVDVFLGPYPALIPAERDSDTVLAPRFSLDVVRRMHDATAKLAGGNGRVVQVV